MFSRLFAVIWIIATLGVPFVSPFIYKAYKFNGRLGAMEDETSNASDNYSSVNSVETDLDRITSSPMKNYFYNLRDNFGYNQTSTCAYVALGMLLTYYDSYYNDNLVPEQYDANAYLNSMSEYASATSPGSNETPIPITPPLNVYEYINTLRENEETSLHAKLVVISNNIMPTVNELYNFLEQYLEINNLISPEDWEIKKDSALYPANIVPDKNITYSEMMLNDIKAYLKQGIPVLVGISQEYGTHAVIAYDYDEEKDIVYAHFGYHNGVYHENIFSEFEYIMGYITMKPTNIHTHSYNYIINNEAKCSCALPNHIHNYKYKQKNSTKHIYYCYLCGYSTEMNHKFTKRGTGIYSKYVICANCGYMKLDDGSLTPILPTSLVTTPEINYEV